MEEAAKYLRKAADMLQDTGTKTVSQKSPDAPYPETTTSRPTTSTSLSNTCSTSISSDIRKIFAPYSCTYGKRKWNGQSAKSTAQLTQQTSWTHKFCCLWSVDSNTIPDNHEKQKLWEAGLGIKKIVFNRTESYMDFIKKLEETFPKLKDCGGIELLRSSSTCRKKLDIIKPDKNGYNSEQLANSYLGQAICFIRPVQQDLELECDDANNNETNQRKEICKRCAVPISINQLREHVENCSGKNDEEMVQENIDCTQLNAAVQNEPSPQQKVVPPSTSCDSKYGKCPLCQEMFLEADLEMHAAVCGDTGISQTVLEEKTLFQELQCLYKSLDKDCWEIPVIRRMLLKTSMVEIERAEDTDWKKKIIIDFIGEEGVDAGGLTREFFSLLFKQTPTFEYGSFSLNSELLDKKHYYLMGKMVAMAIIHGHPGPKCLNTHITNYILQGKEPECTSAQLELLNRDDVLEAVKEIDTVNEENKFDTTEKYAEILEAAGFRKSLNSDTKEEASRAIKRHFIFFRCLPSILQFMDGLKVHGVLEFLQKFFSEGKSFLESDCRVSYADVKNFFKPMFSSDKNKKELEEIIVYHFGTFLKNVERQKITAEVLDVENNVLSNVVVSMGHVLQAFLGCAYLPTDIISGIIEFNHFSEKLSTVNTCAPSLTITQILSNQEYENFENHLINIILRTCGFGMK